MFIYLDEFDNAVRDGGFAEPLQVLYNILCLWKMKGYPSNHLTNHRWTMSKNTHLKSD